MGLLRRLLRPRVAIPAGLGLVAASTIALWRVVGWVALLVLLTLLIVGLIVVIVMLLRRIQDRGAEREIERTVTRQADRDIERSGAAQMDEAKGMKAKLLKAIEELRGRVGPGGFSRIPWYLLVGPAGAGKSTLVLHSDLRFSTAEETTAGRPVPGIGGTRGFDWWLSQDAVVLDMAGRALDVAAAMEDNRDWIEFLRTLAGKRRGRPINGVLLAVGLESLAGMTPAERDKLAGRLRERLQELVRHLGVVFPVYVVFTHADRLAGFREFFADLGDTERSQVWGATVEFKQRPAEEVERVFDNELRALLGVLTERRLRRLADLPDPRQRALAFAFPIQLERLRDPIQRFLAGVFQPDPSQNSPVLRGFYLTSAIQEGAPTDRVMEPAARALGVPAAGSAPPKPAAGTYFVHDLFGRVLSGDAGLAGYSQGRKEQQRIRRVLVAGGLAAAFVLLTVTLSVLSCLNHRVIDRTQKAAQHVHANVKPLSRLDVKLEALEGLRVQLVLLDSLDGARPMWRQVGAYSGDRVFHPALKRYTEAALTGLIVEARRNLYDSLSAQTAAGGVVFIDYFDLFRAYRLLHNPSKLTADEAPTLARVMRRMFRSRMRSGTAEGDRTRDLLDTQVAFLAEHPYWLASLGPERLGGEDQNLVARASIRVRSDWDPAQFYQRMIEEVAPHTQDATLESLVGQTPYLSDSVVVLGPFTRDGWTARVRPELIRLGEHVRLDWVTREAFQDGNRPAELEGQMAALYARDYTARWVRFLDGVRIERPRGVPAAAEMMAVLKEPGSPLLRVLKSVEEQTSLGVDPALPLGQVERDFALLHEFFRTLEGSGERARGASLFDRLLSIAGAARPQAGPRSISALYLAELGKVQEQVNAAAQPGAGLGLRQAILCVGPAIATSAVCNALDWVRIAAADYGGTAALRPVTRVLRLPMEKCQEAVGPPSDGIPPPSVQASPEMVAAWSDLNAEFQKTLGVKYPLGPGPGEATLLDFEKFFKPSGRFWEFHQKYLMEFINQDGSPTPAAQAGVPFSQGFPAVVRKAYEIREALFSENPETASFGFSVTTGHPIIEGPPLLVHKITFDLGGKQAVYQMGNEPPITLRWPGESNPLAGASLRAATASNQSQPEPLGEPGLWGLFRLLERGTMSSSAGRPQVSWTLTAGQSKIRVEYTIQPQSARHPFRPGFLRFRLPASL